MDKFARANLPKFSNALLDFHVLLTVMADIFLKSISELKIELNYTFKDMFWMDLYQLNSMQTLLLKYH